MIKPNKSFTMSLTQIKVDRTLVRTGTYPDGDCFIHALLRAIDSSYRKQTSHFAHLRMVEKFRRDLFEWITPEIYQGLGKEHVRMGFLREFNPLLKEESEKDIQTELHQLIYKVIPYSVLDFEILPKSINERESFYVAFYKEVDQYVRKRLYGMNIEKVDNIIRNAMEYYMEMFKIAHDRAFNSFKEKLVTMGTFVDSLQMECLSQYTGYNFLFITDQTDQTDESYKGIDHMISWDSSRKTLIFLWVQKNHFEIIGELENKNVINRIFDSEDPLVETLKNESRKE